MKKYLLLIIISSFMLAAPAQQQYWQQQVDYSIRVSLDDTRHTLDGFIRMRYHNHSPDTLHYIWLHLWPNAFKSDQTAFSEQMLQNGDTRFYFSSSGQKGYINQLNFRVNEIHANTTDHPEYSDIISLILPTPLLPGEQITITTPFHVQLPDQFSKWGHKGQAYQIAHWYPKPAVYDSKGWHPMPYLQQGQLYSEPGNFDVSITIPENYVVAATGELQNDKEKEWLKTRSSYTWKEKSYRKKTKGGSYKIIREHFPPSSTHTKTLHYKLDNANDFAWFADKRYIVNYDTCLLSSGKIIDVFSFYTSPAQKQYNNAIAYTKNAVKYYSDALAEYPFSAISIVGVPQEMRETYPGLAAFSVKKKHILNERLLAQQIGLNWFSHILLTNNSEYPWMISGMNAFYKNKYPAGEKTNTHVTYAADSFGRIAFESVAKVKKDQPVELPASDFSPLNYYLSTHVKAAQWMQILESRIGKELMDSCMKIYFDQWRFRHPYPENFKHNAESISGKNLDSIFDLLHSRGSLQSAAPKKIRLTWLGKADDQNKYHYVGIIPVPGFNNYDKLQVGIAVHNYSLPFSQFRFVAIPLYATGSHQFNGIGRATYTWYPCKSIDNIEAGISIARFSENRYTDNEGLTTHLRYSKISPQLRINFQNKNTHSSITRFAQLKTHFINTDGLKFSWDPVSSETRYTVNTSSRIIGQLRFVTDNNRALYPYRYAWQLELSEDFGKMTYTGNYFFNYPGRGGLNFRWFAGKFFYMGDKTSGNRLNTDPFQLNLSTPKGYEDYTYSNYFIGRSAYNGFLSQQVMMHDGGFKVRTDLLGNKTGKTDDWLIALNFTSTIHNKIPLKLFLDLGTYNEGWVSGTTQPKILYDAGIQLSFCKDIINLYVPVMYSKVYQDYYKSTPGNKFLQRISFSIDIQNINFKKINPLIPF